MSIQRKEQLWQEMADRASHITDKLGKPIDSGILDNVSSRLTNYTRKKPLSRMELEARPLRPNGAMEWAIQNSNL